MKPLLLLYLVCVIQTLSLAQLELSIPDSLKYSSNAVVLNEEQHTELHNHESYTSYYRGTITVLNEKGSDYLNLSIYYSDGSDQIKDVKCSIYDVDGNLIKSIKKKDLSDYAAGDGVSIITDSRLKHWSYETNNYPVTIDYSYTRTSSNTLFIPRWYPIPNYDVAVVKSSYSITTNDELRTYEQNMDRYPSISKVAGVYTMKNQPSINSEQYGPGRFEIFPTLITNPRKYNYEGNTGQHDDWDEFGQWMYESFLAPKKLKNQHVIRPMLDKYVGETTDTREIIKKVYEYVQDNTRYISVQLDDGGFNPIDPNSTHHNQYGDCKGLTLYTQCLLDLYDIKSNYTVVRAGSYHPAGFINDFASSYPGNHIILNIPTSSDTIWLDCTSHHNPFNYLGTFTDDRNVLVIENGASHIEKTPAYTHENSLMNEEITFDLYGDLQLDVKQSATGYKIKDLLWLSDKPKEKITEYIINSKGAKINLKQLNNVKYSQGDSGITLDYKIDIEEIIESAGSYTFVPMQLAQLDIPMLPKDKNRQSDISFPRGYEHAQTIHINKPKDAHTKLSVEENSSTIDTPYGIFELETTETETAYEIKRSFTLYKGRYDNSQYDEIKTFLDQSIKISLQGITLKSKT